jgi:hypothetical protein
MLVAQARLVVLECGCGTSFDTIFLVLAKQVPVLWAKTY